MTNIPYIGSQHDSETRNIINELIRLFNKMGYSYEESLKKAHEVLAESTKALLESKKINDKNTDVQKQIDKLILESGTSDAEVIQARSNFDTLNSRVTQSLNNVSDSLSSNKSTYSKENTKGTLVILDDDTMKTSYNLLYPFAKKHNFKITLAAISGKIQEENTTHISLSEFKEMRDDPLVEFVNHTHTHPRLANLNAEQIEYEISKCEEFLSDNGIFTKHLVYPYGSVNDLVKQIASKYTNSASKSNGLNVSPNTEVLDTFQLNRIVFEESESTFQSRINQAASTGGCVLINSHSQYDTFDLKKLLRIVNMAKAAGLDIVHYSEAFKRFSNAVEIRKENGELIGGISSFGKTEGIFKREHKFLMPSEVSVNNDSLPEQYPNLLVTSFNITNADKVAKGFPEAGRLFNYRSGPDDYTFQLLHVVNSATVLKRFWDTRTPEWSEWEEVGGSDNYKSSPLTFSLEPGKWQNISINADEVKVGDPIAFSYRPALPNEFVLSGPRVSSDGKIFFRVNNVSNDLTYTVKDFEIVAKKS